MSYCQEIWYQLVSYLKEAMINNYTLSVSTPVCDLIVVSLVLLMVIALVLGKFYTCHQAVYFGSHTNKEEEKCRRRMGVEGSRKLRGGGRRGRVRRYVGEGKGSMMRIGD